jgi:hypothetical protein
MNFYASPEFLESVAEVSCRGKRWSIQDVQIDGRVLRLLVIGNKRLATNVRFLDYHVPVHDSEIKSAVSRMGHAKLVTLGVMELSDCKAAAAKDLELAPYIDWSRFPTYEDYKAFVLGRSRGLVRERERRGRRLAEMFGEPVFRMHDEQDDILPLVQEWKGRQLVATGSENWIIDPEVIEFLNVLRRKDLLVCSTLRVSGRLAAVWIGFIYEGCWSGWIFTRDPQLDKYSPGHHLVSAMLEQSYKLKHREFDFSVGAEDYKMMYATHVRILGPVGRPALGQRMRSWAKEEVKRQVPNLFRMVQGLKKQMHEQNDPKAFGLLLG